jgi:hypothetical protein
MKRAATAPAPSAIAAMGERIERDGRAPVSVPDVPSFREFLLNHAWVRTERGDYAAFGFEGRPVIEFLVAMIDRILGSNGGKPLTDAVLTAAGGAQWGKTTLAENLFAYLLIRFRNVGYYLPDDDLVQGVVDSKFRPDVVDQIPWFANLLSIGKAVNESGRQVSRKGAIMVTDGRRSAQGYFRGCGKIPTTFSMDAIVVDERDDIPEHKARFLAGRMTPSDLRFRFIIGTQRYHGAGANKEWDEGTQHIGMISCRCGRAWNPEDNWPGICRVAMDGTPAPTDPALTLEGEFRRAAEAHGTAYDPEARYYLACPDCGAELDRNAVKFVAQRPDREKSRRFSVRVSQMGTPAIALGQIVADWCLNAVRDPDSMIAFCCDRLAKPKSASQALTPAILTRARGDKAEPMALAPRGFARFAGMDTGDRCWFVAREVEAPLLKRLCWLEQISPASARTRVPLLFNTLGLSCLFIDIGNERELARDLVLTLNDIREQPQISVDRERERIVFAGGLTWHGDRKQWTGLRAAAVEFSLKPGAGLRHEIRRTQEGLIYPVVQANRDETIQRVIDELLTAEEGLVHVVDGRLRTAPILRLPQRGVGCPPIVTALDEHLLAGSRRVRTDAGTTGSFIDKVENHLLLGTAYSALAETVGGAPATTHPFAWQRVDRAAYRADEIDSQPVVPRRRMTAGAI